MGLAEVIGLSFYNRLLTLLLLLLLLLPVACSYLQIGSAIYSSTSRRQAVVVSVLC